VNKALLVARWEFLTTITRRSYIVVVVAIPVFYGFIVGAAALTGRSLARGQGERSIAIVDAAHILDLRFAAAQAAARTSADADPASASAAAETLAVYDDTPAALAALAAHRVTSVYVVEPDYLRTGRITAYGRDSGLFSIPTERRRLNQVSDAVRASLLQHAVAPDVLARAYAPGANVTRMSVDDRGRVSPAPESGVLGPFAGPFAVYFMLTLAIFFSSAFLQQATVEDRQNRMIEILLSSLGTEELLLGKIIGLAAAGLLQVAIYLALLAVPAMTLTIALQIPLAKLALSFFYFLLGYTLFACLMAGTGALGRTAQESAQMSAIWTLTAAAPMGFLAAITAAPSGALARVLSFFPLTAPVTMLLRLSGGDPPLVDIAASIAVCTAAIYLSLRAAAKILRASFLMYGKRATLPELIHWLRAA
jgi:ABC-2 type transport system permease protein